MIRDEHREDLPEEEELRERRSEGERDGERSGEERGGDHSGEERGGERSGEERSGERSGGERREVPSEESLRRAEEAARHSDDSDLNGRKVKGKKKTKWATILLVFTLIALLNSGHYIERTAPTEAMTIPASEGWEMVSTDETKVDYKLNIDGRIYTDAIISALRLGDTAINTSGMVVNSNSLLIGDNEIANKPEYQIMGISIVDVASGRILRSDDLTRETVSEDVLNSNFGTYLSDTLRMTGKDRSQVRIRILLGQKGWIDIDDYISHHCYDDAIIERARYMEGTAYDSGDYITLNNGARIPVKGPDGSYYPSGTIVRDANGVQYRILSLNVTTSHEERPEWVRHEEQHIPASEGGTKISYKIENIDWGIAPLGLIAAGGAYLLENRKKKNDDEEDEEESERSGGRKSGGGKPKGGGSGTGGSERRPAGEPVRTGTIRVRRPYTYSPGTDLGPYSVKLDELHGIRISGEGYAGMMDGLYGEGREGGTARTRH